MIKRKQMIIFMMAFFMIFIVSCGTTADGEKVAGTEEQYTIEQPIVQVENADKGVLITWNEISEAEGYYVYHRIKGEKYSIIAKITDSATVEFVDLEALSGTSYDYAVRAFVGDQKSEYEAVNITTGIWEPTIKVVYKDPEMKITWNEIEGSDGYYVYRKEEGGKYSVISNIEDSTITSYVDEDVVVGKIYTYAVRAYIGKEKSTFTAVTKATIGQPIVEIKDVNDGVEVSWNEIEEAEGYYVYRKEEGGKYEVLQKIEDNHNTAYVDTNFTVGITYIYAVRSYLGSQKSSFDEVDITADLGRVSVSLSASNSGVQLEWNKISAAEGYNIYRKAEGEEEYTLINEVDDASITSYLDMQVEAGKTYYYNVRAFLGDEQSEYQGSMIVTK